MRSIVAIVVLSLTIGLSCAQEPDLDAGASEARKCMACHNAGEGATNKIGPVLNDVFGRRAGTYPGFSYSNVMIDAGKMGLVWTAETISDFIAAPRDFLPGTKMTFAGERDDEDRANLIAYLRTFSPDYVPPKVHRKKV
jgi:cytochrome c